MTSTPPPRRRPSPAVYRRRRLAVLLVLLLVVAGVVALLLWQPWRSVAATAPHTPKTPAAASSPIPSPIATSPTPEVSSPAPSPTAPTPSGTASPLAACTTRDITVLAVTDHESYGAGQRPKLSITLTNGGDEPCLMNVGTATQQFVISSGSDTWWRSTDCQTESSDQVVQIAAGQTVSSVTPIEWDRSRSSVDTCDKKRPQAPSGYFHLSVSIGGIEAADTAMFALR